MTLISSPAKLRSRAPADASPQYDAAGKAAGQRKGRSAELSLTVTPLPGDGIMEIFGRLSGALKESDATILHMMVFASLGGCATAMEAMRRCFGRVDFPVTWVEGSACDGRPVAGMQVAALAGGEVERIRLNGRVVGSAFQDGAARHCLLGGLGPVEGTSSRAAQTRQSLDQLERALALAGFSLADTVRTWFFLEDILSWYDEFNQARTRAYSGVRFRTGSLPASTGVGGRNPAGTALALSARAMRSTRRAACAEEIISPLQCPAPAYGSSFSRAMELASFSGRRLFISGTASISPDGRTLWKEDARKQVEVTMGVVEAILRSRGFSFSELTRATAYFKRRADLRAFAQWWEARGLLSLPVVAANCEICREDLLFELEAEAWCPGRTGGEIQRTGNRGGVEVGQC